MDKRQGAHKVAVTEENGVRTVIYRFLGQVEGRGRFAEVCLRTGEIQEQWKVTFNENKIVPTKDVFGASITEWANYADYKQAAAFGIHYALANHKEYNTIQAREVAVLHILENAVDTNPDTIAYTAAFATWELFSSTPIDEPFIKDHQVHFPGKKPALLQ